MARAHAYTVGVEELRQVVRMDPREGETHHAAAPVRRRSQHMQFGEARQSLCRTAHERELVRVNSFHAQCLEVGHRGSETHRTPHIRRAGLELVREHIPGGDGIAYE